MPELSPEREYKTTASQAPIIIGGTEQQLMTLWEERVGIRPPADLSNVLPVQLGKHCEPFILNWVERTGQHELTERQRFIPHPTLPSVACTLDAYRPFDDAVVEAKMVNPFGDRDKTLAWYTPQVCVQMGCRGASRGVLAIMRGFTLEEIEVEVDQAYLNQMWARLAAFQLCCELMREPVHQSPLVPPEQWRTINLATMSPMPNWGSPMIQCMRMWSDTKEAVVLHENSKKSIKELLPDDVGKVTYGDLSVSRSKNGAVTIRERTHMNQLTTLPAAPTMLWPMQATERMQLCRELATARLVPPAFQKSPADIFLAMNTIERLGLDFFLTIGECYVVQGKIGFSGKLAAAIINSCGQLSERLSYTYEGEGDDRTITVAGRLQGEGEPREIKVRLADARTRNENWTKQPDQMLGYAGARTWGRRHLSEVLLGMRFDDEINVEPQLPAEPKRVVPEIVVPPEQSTAPEGSAVPPRPEPYSLAGPDDNNDPDQWRGWGADFITLVRASESLEEVGGWLGENQELLEILRELAPKIHGNLENAVEKHRKKIREKQEAT